VLFCHDARVWARSRSSGDGLLEGRFSDLKTKVRVYSGISNIHRKNFLMNTSKGIIETVTVAGIYDLRRLQIKHCGRLDLKAVLALDCCPPITPIVQVTAITIIIFRQLNSWYEILTVSLQKCYWYTCMCHDARVLAYTPASWQRIREMAPISVTRSEF